MEVGHAEEIVEAVLLLHPHTYRADIVTYMQPARWLNSRQDCLLPAHKAHKRNPPARTTKQNALIPHKGRRLKRSRYHPNSAQSAALYEYLVGPPTQAICRYPAP